MTAHELDYVAFTPFFSIYPSTLPSLFSLNSTQSTCRKDIRSVAPFLLSHDTLQLSLSFSNTSNTSTLNTNMTTCVSRFGHSAWDVSGTEVLTPPPKYMYAYGLSATCAFLCCSEPLIFTTTKRKLFQLPVCLQTLARDMSFVQEGHHEPCVS